ncbi:MAG: alpha/beta fold hydrolase [Planctomycetota bacterium]
MRPISEGISQTDPQLAGLDGERWEGLRRSLFRPHPAFRGAHANTIAAALWPRPTRRLRHLRREWWLHVPRGTVLRVECYEPEGPKRRALVISHGLEGSSRSGYVLSTAAKALAQGRHVYCLNTRNCGGTVLLTPTLYHAGLTEDLAAVVASLKAQGFESIDLCGFSLGGNMALKLAAEWGVEAAQHVRSVAAISPCLDLPVAAQRLEHRDNRFYQRQFVSSCKKLIRLKSKLDPSAWSVTGLDEIRTLREFDARFTAPDAGFRDVDEYYEKASALPKLGSLTTPSLIIQAQDDPLIPFESFERPEITEHPWIELLAPECGGHNAFLSAKGPDPDRFWAEHRLFEFLEALEEFEDEAPAQTRNR